MSKTPEFVVGDNVAYSVQWLRSVGMRQSHLAHARGVVTEVKPFGSTSLARIDWNDTDVPERVNVANLAHVGPNLRFCEC
jgi:hypothetical protein